MYWKNELTSFRHVGCTGKKIFLQVWFLQLNFLTLSSLLADKNTSFLIWSRSQRWHIHGVCLLLQNSSQPILIWGKESFPLACCRPSPGTPSCWCVQRLSSQKQKKNTTISFDHGWSSTRSSEVSAMMLTAGTRHSAKIGQTNAFSVTVATVLCLFTFEEWESRCLRISRTGQSRAFTAWSRQKLLHWVHLTSWMATLRPWGPIFDLLWGMWMRFLTVLEKQASTGLFPAQPVDAEARFAVWQSVKHAFVPPSPDYCPSLYVTTISRLVTHLRRLRMLLTATKITFRPRSTGFPSTSGLMWRF